MPTMRPPDSNFTTPTGTSKPSRWPFPIATASSGAKQPIDDGSVYPIADNPTQSDRFKSLQLDEPCLGRPKSTALVE